MCTTNLSNAPSYKCLFVTGKIPGGNNVRRAFCFLYQVKPDVRIILPGELGFANWGTVTDAEVKNLIEYYEAYQSKV